VVRGDEVVAVPGIVDANGVKASVSQAELSAAISETLIEETR
jgi:hypothetical protein